jgi:hypothetical protein
MIQSHNVNSTAKIISYYARYRSHRINLQKYDKFFHNAKAEKYLNWLSVYYLNNGYYLHVNSFKMAQIHTIKKARY